MVWTLWAACLWRRIRNRFWPTARARQRDQDLMRLEKYHAAPSAQDMKLDIKRRIGSGRLSVPIQQAEQPIAHASRYT